MRQKRAKQYRKQLAVLKTTFKFKTPIQCLVDDSTIIEAQECKFNLIKGIDNTVQLETKCFITQCCINHLYESKNQEAIDIAKRMEKRRCGHKNTLSSLDCIQDITNIKGENKFRYLVVTQNEELRSELRKIAGVPLIYLNRSVIIMEPLSRVTKKVVDMVEKSKLVQGLNSSKAGVKRPLEDEKEDMNNKNISNSKNDNSEEGKKKEVGVRKKKIKGVNPLSMKKKQKKNDIVKEDEKEEVTEKKRRRRKHNGSKKEEQVDEIEEENGKTLEGKEGDDAN